MKLRKLVSAVLAAGCMATFGIPALAAETPEEARETIEADVVEAAVGAAQSSDKAWTAKNNAVTIPSAFQGATIDVTIPSGKNNTAIINPYRLEVTHTLFGETVTERGEVVSDTFTVKNKTTVPLDVYVTLIPTTSNVTLCASESEVESQPGPALFAYVAYALDNLDTVEIPTLSSYAQARNLYEPVIVENVKASNAQPQYLGRMQGVEDGIRYGNFRIFGAANVPAAGAKITWSAKTRFTLKMIYDFQPQPLDGQRYARVSFDADAGADRVVVVQGSMEEISILADRNGVYRVTPPTLSRNGFAVTGWSYTAPNGSQVYVQDGGLTISDTSEPVTLKAHWERADTVIQEDTRPVGYVVFQRNEPSDAEESAISSTPREYRITGGTVRVTLPSVSLDGYTLLGWYHSGTNLGTSGSVTLNVSEGETVTLTARWQKLISDSEKENELPQL